MISTTVNLISDVHTLAQLDKLLKEKGIELYVPVVSGGLPTLGIFKEEIND